MDSVFAVIAGTVVGLMVGVEFAVAFVMNPILSGLPGDAALLASRGHGARMMGRVMPFWYFGSLILTTVLAVVTWGTPTSATALAAVVFLAISIVISVAVLVPINNRSAKWTPEERPDDWREQLRRWDAVHYARVAIILVAFVLVEVAATLL